MKDIGWLVILGVIVLLLSGVRLQSRPATNEEVLEWTDYRGHVYRITAHREVY